MLAAAVFGHLIISLFVFLGSVGFLLLGILLFLAYLPELKGFPRRFTYLILCFIAYKSFCRAIFDTTPEFFLVFLCCIVAIKLLFSFNSDH